MLSFLPVAGVLIRGGSYPAGGDGAIAILEAIAAREAAEHEFEIARLLPMARLNRHAETEG